MGKILVADDEPDMRALLADLLEEAGHEVTEAENGQVAVQQVERELDTPFTYHVTKPWRRGVVESAVRTALAQSTEDS